MEYHQYNGRGRQVSWWSTATGPHASDLRVTHTAFHFLSLFPDITALMGVSLASWLACQLLGCTHRPASLVVAQAQDQRKSLQTGAETSIALDNGILQEGSWSNTLLCAADSGRDTAEVFTTRGRSSFYRGIDIMNSQL